MPELHATLRQWLVTADDSYVEQDQSEHWVFRFEVPRSVWTDDIMPARGSATPDELGGVGTVLTRQVRYREMSGSVVCILTCGWSGWDWFDGSGIVTMRPILVEQKRLFSANGTALTGDVYVADDQSDRKYGVLGANAQEEVPFQAIRIHTMMTPAAKDTYAGTVGGRSGQVNSVAWTLGGVVCGINFLMFRGMSSDYARNSLVNGIRMHTVLFDFLLGPVAWPLNTTRYEWERGASRVPIGDPAAPDGHTTVHTWAADSTTATVLAIRTAFDFKGSLSGLL